MTEAKREKKGH